MGCCIAISNFNQLTNRKYELTGKRSGLLRFRPFLLLRPSASEPLSISVMIITSLLDTDLYKFTMMQVVLHHFPAANVEYRYKCRTPNINLAAYLDEIRDEIEKLCQLRFTEDELQYLRGLRFIKSDFVDFLGLFQLSQKNIHVAPSAVPGEIEITVKGPWLHTILFEIPVLAIVNEVYFRNTCKEPAWEEGRRRLQEKMA